MKQGYVIKSRLFFLKKNTWRVMLVSGQKVDEPVVHARRSQKLIAGVASVCGRQLKNQWYSKERLALFIKKSPAG